MGPRCQPVNDVVSFSVRRVPVNKSPSVRNHFWRSTRLRPRRPLRRKRRRARKAARGLSGNTVSSIISAEAAPPPIRRPVPVAPPPPWRCESRVAYTHARRNGLPTAPAGRPQYLTLGAPVFPDTQKRRRHHAAADGGCTEPVSVTSAPGKGKRAIVGETADRWLGRCIRYGRPAGIVKDDPPGHSAACTLMAMPTKQAAITPCANPLLRTLILRSSLQKLNNGDYVRSEFRCKAQRNLCKSVDKKPARAMPNALRRNVIVILYLHAGLH